MMRYWGNNMMNNWGSWCGGGSSGYFSYFGPILNLIIWVVLIVGVVFLVRWLANQGKQSPKGEDAAMKILRERYAEGKITKEEFESRKKDLSG